MSEPPLSALSGRRPVVCVGSVDGERRRAFSDSVQDSRVAWVTWSEVIDGTVDWQVLLRDHPVLRLDSPSDDPTVDAILSRLGGADTSPTVTDGRLLRHDLWYRGFARVLGMLDDQLAAAPGHTRLQPSATVLAMFDKAHTAEVLTLAGVATPPTRPATTVDEVMDLLAGRPQSFVKIRYGSSAAGMMAVRHHRDRWSARSTVDPATGRNLPRPVHLTDRADITAAVGLLVPQGVVVQPWVPKVTVAGGAMDLRVVVIGGRARHVLPRIAPDSPFTNLHLGARRGSPERVRDTVGEDLWASALRTAEQALAAFDRPTLYAGVDVLLPAGGRRPLVLEVNAFGDFHEGIEVDGLDTYRAQLAVCDEGEWA